MKDDDIRNLLGGFATGTLTAEERQLLFSAALDDQELFNALADEEALRELLSDPASRRRVLQAIEPGGTRLLDRLSDPIRLRRWWALAGGLAFALVAVVALRQTAPPAARPQLQAAKEEDRLARVENRPAAPAPEPAQREAAATPRKMKVAVLDFDAGPGKSKDAQAASDLLGKKLDAEGYSVVDRKRVDEALQAQNLGDRPLDAASAANVGRQVGADAVIVGSVKPAAAPAPMRAKAAEQVAVTATAINSQTAGSVAYAQGGQQQSAGLAEAVDQVASSLKQQLEQKKALVSVGGLVTEVNEKTLTLNIGASGGVKIGDRLEVRRAGKTIGRVVIGSVRDLSSTGVYDGSDAAKVGDTVASQ